LSTKTELTKRLAHDPRERCLQSGAGASSYTSSVVLIALFAAQLSRRLAMIDF
jgi:hypothetical protein